MVKKRKSNKHGLKSVMTTQGLMSNPQRDSRVRKPGNVKGKHSNSYKKLQINKERSLSTGHGSDRIRKASPMRDSEYGERHYPPMHQKLIYPPVVPEKLSPRKSPKRIQIQRDQEEPPKTAPNNTSWKTPERPKVKKSPLRTRIKRDGSIGKRRFKSPSLPKNFIICTKPLHQTSKTLNCGVIRTTIYYRHYVEIYLQNINPTTVIARVEMLALENLQSSHLARKYISSFTKHKSKVPMSNEHTATVVNAQGHYVPISHIQNEYMLLPENQKQPSLYERLHMKDNTSRVRLHYKVSVQKPKQARLLPEYNCLHINVKRLLFEPNNLYIYTVENFTRHWVDVKMYPLQKMYHTLEARQRQTEIFRFVPNDLETVEDLKLVMRTVQPQSIPHKTCMVLDPIKKHQWQATYKSQIAPSSPQKVHSPPRETFLDNLTMTTSYSPVPSDEENESDSEEDERDDENEDTDDATATNDELLVPPTNNKEEDEIEDLNLEDKVDLGPEKPVIAKYKDPVFTTTTKSIYHPGWSGERHPVIWTNADEIFPSDYSLISYVSAYEIAQGKIGNCWFISALSALASKHPEHIKTLFVTKHRQHSGQYTIRICFAGQWVRVTVDDMVPCFEDERPYRPRFSHNRGPQLWVILLEKAYAKLHGSYLSLKRGKSENALTDLTGFPTKRIEFAKNWKNATNGKLFEDIVKYLEHGHVICTSTKAGVNKQLIGLGKGHAYTILDAVAYKEISLLKLRDPRGHNTSRLPYNRNDPIWEKSPELKNVFVCDHPTEFWISYKDFINYFHRMSVCYISKNWSEKRIRVLFTESTIEPIRLRIKKSSEIVFTLHQEDKRILESDSRYSSIGLMMSDQDRHRLMLNMPFAPRRMLRSHKIKLSRGTYWVMPLIVPWLKRKSRSLVMALHLNHPDADSVISVFKHPELSCKTNQVVLGSPEFFTSHNLASHVKSESPDYVVSNPYSFSNRHDDCEPFFHFGDMSLQALQEEGYRAIKSKKSTRHRCVVYVLKKKSKRDITYALKVSPIKSKSSKKKKFDRCTVHFDVSCSNMGIVCGRTEGSVSLSYHDRYAFVVRLCAKRKGTFSHKCVIRFGEEFVSSSGTLERSASVNTKKSDKRSKRRSPTLPKVEPESKRVMPTMIQSMYAHLHDDG